MVLHLAEKSLKVGEIAEIVPGDCLQAGSYSTLRLDPRRSCLKSFCAEIHGSGAEAW